MKNSTLILNQTSIIELSSDEQRALYGGGDIAGDIGYSIGFAAGYFFAAGPILIGRAISIARFLV